MKIVASTRLSRAQRAMAVSRVYGTAQQEVFNKAETTGPEAPEKKLLVVLSSDKGLCGSIHTQISKKARSFIAENPNTDVVAVGDKVKAQISRTHPDNIVLSVSQIGKEAPSFTEAALIADKILSLGVEYDKVEVLYNKFVSGMSFEPTPIPAFSQKDIENSPKLGSFEIEDEVSQNLAEFAFANYIQWGMAEGHASEISARRNAMDNASKNANDMIGKFTILYNRTRQAVITNELVDIITGASSLE